MITEEQNEILTRVGRGTPAGELLRRYWYPVAGVSELDEEPVLPVRLLGDDLVLFKDLNGRIGLLDAACPHRKVSLTYGIPEEEGLRCCYHGWLFDTAGHCLEQPAEPPSSRFHERVRQGSYPVETLGGLVFAYLGPLPAPLLPRFDVFVWDEAWRDVGKAMIPCNWLQCVENSVDLTHVDYLHGRYYDYVLRRSGREPRARSERVFGGKKQVEMAFDRFAFGLKKRRRLEGEDANAEWKEGGNPLVFPNMTRAGGRGSLQIRVPVDDTNTLTFLYSCYRPDDGEPVPPQEQIPVYEVPLYDERGRFKTDWITGQDMMAWAMQGAVMDRTTEQLGVSDLGIRVLRDLIFEQIDKVEAGEDPIGVTRDPAENELIVLQTDEVGPPRTARYMDNHWQQFSPIYNEAYALMTRHARKQAELSQAVEEAANRAAVPGNG